MAGRNHSFAGLADPLPLPALPGWMIAVHPRRVRGAEGSGTFASTPIFIFNPLAGRPRHWTLARSAPAA